LVAMASYRQASVNIPERTLRVVLASDGPCVTLTAARCRSTTPTDSSRSLSSPSDGRICLSRRSR
jgi:hypothetical protein